MIEYTREDLENEIRYLEEMEREIIRQQLQELEKQETLIKARNHFFDFIRYVSPWIFVNSYIKNICDFIQDVVQCIEQGKETKALVEAPVRHMKSILISQHLPAYFIGRNKDANIICCSASDNLLRRNSRRMESILRQPEYIEIFGDAYAPRVNGIERVNSANNKEIFQGEFTSYTVGSAILGTGANLLIVDDPFRNTKHAWSVTEQDNIWDWYSNDILSRLEGRNGLFIMHQRLHENDLAGRIKRNEEDFAKWHYRSYKAIQDDGTALHEQLVPLARLLERQKTMSNFDAMYQQNPVKIGGNIIKTNLFNRYDALPEKFDQVYIVADTALKSGTYSDFSVFMLFGVTDKHDVYIIDVMREKLEAPQLLLRAIDFYTKHAETYTIAAFYIEDKASGTGLIQHLKEERIPVAPLMPVKDKFLRVNDILHKLQYTYIPKSADWVYDFLIECERFTHNDTHQHDDQVDCLAYGLSNQCMGNGRDWDISDDLISVFLE